MKVGIVGLGLIGGSFAKAYQEAGHQVAACDADQSVLEFARMSGAVHQVLDASTLPSCDLVLIAIYPQAAVAWLKEMAPHIGPRPVVVDCCGVKRAVCPTGFALAEQWGFTYLGGMSDEIATPRLKQPRVKIPAGSVGIAGSQTGVYPIDSPGGWQLIGKTPVRMYDPDRAEPILPKAGEYIKFYSITQAEFDAIAAQEAAGTYECKRHPRKEGGQ